MKNDDAKDEIKVSSRFTITFDFEEQIVEAKIEKIFGAKPETRNTTVKV